MFQRMSRIGAVAALVLGMVLVPAGAASAADGCGSGWYKGSDGYLTKDGPWTGAGNHNAYVYHAGRVRWCNEDDTFNDDENRRALIGYPQSPYAFESQVMKNGTYSKFCVRQTIRAHLSGIKSSSSWSIGGEAGLTKGSASVNASYSATYDTVTVTVTRAQVCGASNRQIIAQTSGITLTGDNESGKVDWVQLTTRISAEYTVNGVKYGVSHSLSEYDYS